MVTPAKSLKQATCDEYHPKMCLSPLSRLHQAGYDWDIIIQEKTLQGG